MAATGMGVDMNSEFPQARREFLKGTVAAGATTALAGTGSAWATGARASAAPGRAAGEAGSRELLRPDLTRALDVRCRAKVAQAVRILDDMESDQHWVASPAVALSYSSERARSGTRSLRFQTHQRNAAYLHDSRQKNGSFTGAGVLFDGTPYSASARLKFGAPQDWSGFNRISLWCYLHPTANPITSLSLQFLCEDAAAGPTDPVAVHYVADLKPGEWNHLTWEIPEYRRDRVSEFVLFQPLFGLPVRDGDDTLTYDLDELQLEQVDVEVVSGWAIPPGKISYSHVGYLPGDPKIALCADQGQAFFDLIDAATGRVLAHWPTRPITNERGHYRLLDFSAFSTPGLYRLRCAEAASEAFPIDDRVWRRLIEQTLNAFYGLRCGCAIAGVHDACHLDVFVTYRGERRVLGGGWHDAANLTQGAGRTHLSIYALLQLYERLCAADDPALAARALEEARWGLDWSLRMQFAGGLRCNQGMYAYYTDGIVGTDDDVVQENVVDDPFQNILAALATSAAARVLRATDRPFSAQLLQAAAADYSSVLTHYPEPPGSAEPIGINQGSWRDRVGYLTLTAVELFRASGRQAYAADAVRFGRWLLDVQEQRITATGPITGYFYEDAGRTRLVHEFHNGFEESGLLAFKALCEVLPGHPEWMRWYAALLLHSEYFCREGSRAAAPFDILPSAVWRLADLDHPDPEDPMGRRLAAVANPLFPTPPTPDLVAAQKRAMYEAGTRLSDQARLRIFPLWPNHIQHGATTVHLGKTAALMAAAQVRHRRDLAELAARQLQWVVGANPFSRSLIYGVGYDFWQNFTVSLPNLVGGLSLGFNSYEGDAPAWGNNAVFPYKEMWVFSSCRVALNLAQLGMPARVKGHAATNVTLTHQRTQAVTRIRPGRFDIQVSPGEYALSGTSIEAALTFVDGGSYTLVLDPREFMTIDLQQKSAGGAAVTLKLTARGSGHHELELRLFNASCDSPRRPVRLKRGVPLELEWTLNVLDPHKPWVALAVPDSEPTRAREVLGTLQELAGLS